MFLFLVKYVYLQTNSPSFESSVGSGATLPSTFLTSIRCEICGLSLTFFSAHSRAISVTSAISCLISVIRLKIIQIVNFCYMNVIQVSQSVTWGNKIPPQKRCTKQWINAVCTRSDVKAPYTLSIIVQLHNNVRRKKIFNPVNVVRSIRYCGAKLSIRYPPKTSLRDCFNRKSTSQITA